MKIDGGKITIFVSLILLLATGMSNSKEQNFIQHRELESTNSINSASSHNEHEGIIKITVDYDPIEKHIFFNGKKYLDEEEIQEHGEVDISKLTWNYIITNSFIILCK